MENEFTGEVSLTRRAENGVSVRKLSDVYEEYAKLVFLFDVSGSMHSRVTNDFYVDSFAWPKDMSALRVKIEGYAAKFVEAFNRNPGVLLGGTGDEKLDVSISLVDQDTLKVKLTDEELKAILVRHNFTSAFGVEIDWAKHNAAVPSRIDLVRRLAKQEIEKRIEKYPKGGISVICFNSEAKVVFDEGKKDDLWKVMDSINPSGGTEIVGALRTAVEVCRNKPSKIGIHHFVIVTDGQDDVPETVVEEWPSVLKQSGIVIDYIHIGDLTDNENLHKLCTATGGAYFHCNDEKSFTDQFVEAVRRPMLPPAAV